MVTVIKDEKDKIVAYAEYRIVGKDGKDDEFGEYVWINYCWVHPSIRFHGALKKMVTHEYKPYVKWIYFIRSIHNERTRIYDIKKFLKKGENFGQFWIPDTNTTYSPDGNIESARVYKSVATVTCD